MALDNAQFISELSITDPPGTDPLSEGDDQIRTAKRSQFQSLPFLDKQVNLTSDQMNEAAIKDEANVFTQANQQFTDENFIQRSAAGTFARWAWRNEAGNKEWEIYLNTAAAGNNLLFQRRDDGTFLDLPFQLSHATGAMLSLDGDAVNPQYSFTSQPGTGMYRPGTSIGWSIAGVNAAFLLPAQFRMELSGSVAAPAYSFQPNTNMGMYRGGANILGLATAGLEALTIDAGQTTTVRKECTVTRNNDTQARTGWRYTNAANQPVWSIYMGTDPNNTLAFQRYVGGAFQDIPFSIRNSNGLLRMSTLPTSSAGLISGELWRNPVSPGFVAIV